MPVDATLMRACSVLFLFRSLAAAVAASEDRGQASRIEGQLLSLFSDWNDDSETEGFILLGKSETELCALAKERGDDAGLVQRVCREGAVDGAAPLYVHGKIAGLIAVNLPSQTLAAVATLASAALGASGTLASGTVVQSGAVVEITDNRSIPETFIISGTGVGTSTTGPAERLARNAANSALVLTSSVLIAAPRRARRAAAVRRMR